MLGVGGLEELDDPRGDAGGRDTTEMTLDVEHALGGASMDTARLS